MPPITPLPQFEADLEEDRKAYEKLKAPTSMVVRFGKLKMVAELPYNGDAKPGCGSKLVARTFRGTELVEMLTSTCPNSGCSKAVSRKDLLQYIENSGGKDYPFYTRGRVLRVATLEDLNRQATLDAQIPDMIKFARRLVEEMELKDVKIVDAEPILSRERITFYFTSEERIDFRDMVSRLASEYSARIDMRQIGARDEARIVADYERCGQHCCCKQFLKVLKPVSMRMAKVQKATLDPLKISGRCGRLMCCLRYEDATYEELRKRLPKRKVTVNTPEGPGIVLDTQILTQLVLVRLETGRDIAVPVEDLEGADKSDPVKTAAKKARQKEREAERQAQRDAQGDAQAAGGVAPTDRPGETSESGEGEGAPTKKKRKRRRRKKKGASGEGQATDGATTTQHEPSQPAPSSGPAGEPGEGDVSTGPDGEPVKKKRRRRRRRRKPGGGDGAGGAPEGGTGDGGGGGSPPPPSGTGD